MKAPIQHPNLIGSMSHKIQTSRSSSYAYRNYQQKRRRNQRIALLVFGFLCLLIFSALAIWGVCQAAPRIVYHTEPADYRAFETYMDQKLGMFSSPSLLYYHNLDYALLSESPVGMLKSKLLPVMPVQEDTTLKELLERMLAEYPGNRFQPHLYFYNPQNATSVEINGYSPVAAASVIKLPILLDYMMSLDENLITFDTPLLYAEFHRARGAGELQYRPAGQDFPANEIASQMIRISDNTCTNMMISYLGGSDAVNRRLSDLGLVHTRIRNWLPDLNGTNTISAYEMVTILYNIDHGPLISEISRLNGINILESTHNRRLLVWPLPKEAKVAHKTGDIGTALGDSGIVYMPDGQKYFISMQVERPYNDYTARDMVQRASRIIYDYVAAQKAAPLLSPDLQAKALIH